VRKAAGITEAMRRGLTDEPKESGLSVCSLKLPWYLHSYTRMHSGFNCAECIYTKTSPVQLNLHPSAEVCVGRMVLA